MLWASGDIDGLVTCHGVIGQMERFSSIFHIARPPIGQQYCLWNIVSRYGLCSPIIQKTACLILRFMYGLSVRFLFSLGALGIKIVFYTRVEEHTRAILITFTIFLVTGLSMGFIQVDVFRGSC